MKRYLISIDQSTTSTKVLLIGKDGRVVHRVSRIHKQYCPEPGWVEQDAIEIYNNVLQGIQDVLNTSHICPSDVSALAITNQTGAFVVWDKKTGLPVYRMIGWQCTRGEEVVKCLSDKEAETIFLKTGDEASGYAIATKLGWLFRHYPDIYEKAKRGEVLFGSVDCWLVWKLTGGKKHVTDYGNASIAQMIDINQECWSKEVLDILGIPEEILPALTDSDGDFGVMSVEGFPAWPIGGVIGDSNGALFGQCCFHEGDIKVTYGTGTSILINAGSRPVTAKNGLQPAIAWRRNGVPTYVLEGTAICAGASISWLVDDLGLIDHVSQTEELALSIDGTEGVYLVSAFNGLGTPYWDSDAKGCIIGLRQGVKKEHIVRAALEGIAYQVCDMLYAGVGKNTEGKCMMVDGIMTKNQFLMQFQADITGIRVVQNHTEECSAMGAAYLAGLKCGVWKDEGEIRSLCGKRRIYTPRMSRTEAGEKYNGWLKAVKSSLSEGFLK